MKFFVIVSLVLVYIAVISARKCRDRHRRLCRRYRRYCENDDSNGEYMRKNCRVTCKTCQARPITEAPPVVDIPPHVGGCGQPDVKGITRVIAGKTAVRGSWPWQILMFFRGRAICGGTLIAPQWVVTAAHCVYGNEKRARSFSIKVGEHDRTIYHGSEVKIRVTRVYRHSKYNPKSLNNDIAMFKLERPVTFNKYVSPICLPKKQVQPGSKCFITGWGKIKHPGTMTRFLQQAILPVVSNEKCYEYNKKVINIPVTDAMICGGDGGASRRSGCHGDSGGPFVCQVNGVWELHGSVSYGSSKCKSGETYTVFSRTYHFLDWIKGNMNGN